MVVPLNDVEIQGSGGSDPPSPGFSWTPLGGKKCEDILPVNFGYDVITTCSIELTLEDQIDCQVLRCLLSPPQCSWVARRAKTLNTGDQNTYFAGFIHKQQRNISGLSLMETTRFWGSMDVKRDPKDRNERPGVTNKMSVSLPAMLSKSPGCKETAPQGGLVAQAIIGRGRVLALDMEASLSHGPPGYLVSIQDPFDYRVSSQGPFGYLVSSQGPFGYLVFSQDPFVHLVSSQVNKMGKSIIIHLPNLTDQARHLDFITRLVTTTPREQQSAPSQVPHLAARDHHPAQFHPTSTTRTC
uniref:Uncharacterized protein n=1 Tax=Timema douglasi TaxID=61478 RepID=A0A7R8Z448_TIMDO|nr:unnamed protein product [Timema douglasi]